MKIRNKVTTKVLTLFLAVVTILGVLPLSAFAAPAAGVPESMRDNAILRALQYTGYNVQKQKDNGTLYQKGYYGSRLESNAPDILSKISYGTALSGKETVANSSTKTGLAPDIARFERNGLCCAGFVTYFICNYLPNIEGADTQFITDAVNAVGSNSQAVITWQKALENLVAQGKIEKVGTSSSNVDYNRLVPGDIIIFGNSTKSHVHTAIYAGTYNGTHFIIHVGNDRGPEISTVEGMGHSSNGDKASVPNGFYHLPDEIFQQRGSIEVRKTDESGKALAGAVFIATSTTNPSLVYKIGPTNNSGYASTGKVIPFGTYTVKETVFPKNYQAHGKTEWTVTLDKNTPNATVTINAVNTLIPGSAKIVKTSEDGKVDGVSFRVQGNGVDKTVQTKNGGQIQIDNLKPGVYTVTELVENKYEPQEVRRVTVVSGQTATVTFSNVLKRGDLTVTKTAEDGLSEGAKFHLYGTSLSGLAVNEYAVVGNDGKAYFKDVLIGTEYTLEEIDTNIRYIVPEKQTADIEWNKVTNKSFENILKKWQITVTKSDKETGTAQGDASLGGAKYGIYKGDQLVDTYTTDINGQFTTKFYICDSDWSLREISSSEGYLVTSGSEHIGAEAKLYTVEYNSTALDVLETVQKGKIAVIKHCDDGSTQIETPETGAEFEVYLKRSGSYETAKESERDILICDEFGFAESKDLPYGIYTVRQTKGWEGKELLPPFDVFVKEDGETYRYLINNATFESLIEIVKKDIETGKTIPASGIGFKVRNTDTGEYIVQHINYPTPVDIDIYYTDTTGKLMMPETIPYGHYEIIEQNACYGYVLDSNPVPFTIDGSHKIVTVEKHNIAQKGRITVTKTGEVFSSVAKSDGLYQPVYSAQGLAGAVYEITAAEDIYTLDGTLRYTKGDVVAEITTDSTGTATTESLYLGKFEVRETKAPYGMTISDEMHSVELTYAGQEVEITETATSFYNERQKAEISLVKVLAQDERFQIGMNGEILSVQFGLFAAEELTAADSSVIPADGLLEIVNCDENGNAMFKTDIPVGAKLYVKELAVDSHYILSDEKYPVEFVYAGQDTALVEIKANDGNPIENVLIYGTVKGLKIDRETEEPIMGAVFGLFHTDETEFTAEKAITTTESGEDGIFTFENIPYGSWIIKELQPAEGFIPNEEIYPVTVSEHEQLIEISVVNDRIPEIGTQAVVDGKKEICATDVFTLTDTVSYQHLIPGKEYVLKGVLMDKATGKPLLIDGEEIHAETAFTPEEPTGEVTVEFTFDAKFIKTETDIVVFETLYRDGKELAVHADIEDKDQTVTVKIPEIGTQATVDGKKEITTSERVVIEDIVSYKNLTPGKEYTVKGILMNKSTGEPLLVDGKEIRSSFTFKPDTPDGEVIVTFVFDASRLTTSTEIVVFESLYRDGVEIAAHADIEDEGQTVKLTPPAPLVPDIPKSPQTGDNSNLGFWIGLAAIAVGGLISCGIMAVKRKKDDDE